MLQSLLNCADMRMQPCIVWVEKDDLPTKSEAFQGHALMHNQFLLLLLLLHAVQRPLHRNAEEDEEEEIDS